MIYLTLGDSSANSYSYYNGAKFSLNAFCYYLDHSIKCLNITRCKQGLSRPNKPKQMELIIPFLCDSVDITTLPKKVPVDILMS